MHVCRKLSKSSDKRLYVESIRSNANATCQNEFISKTDKRAMSGKAQRLIKTSILINEKYLNQKRERLRELLSIENGCYQQEFLDDVKLKTKEKLKTRENRLLGIKAERERQRLKFADQMKVQQLINNCDEIRPYLRRKLQDEYKNCQLLQIEDNSIKRKEQLDQDRLWNDVQNQVFGRMTKRERDMCSLTRSRNLDSQEILRKQIAEKSEIIQKDEYEEDTMNCGKALHLHAASTNVQEHPIQTKVRQRQYAQDLLRQQEEKAKTQRDTKNREITDDLALIHVVNDDIRISMENSNKQKIQNMKETLHFLDYLKNVRNDKCLAEREKEKITETLRNQKNCEYLKNRNQFTHQRDEFNKGIHQERWKQIMDRKEKILREKNQKIKEICEANKMYAENTRMENVLVEKKRNVRRQYGQELLAQWNYEKEKKDEAQFAINKVLEYCEKEEATKSELVNTNLDGIHESYPVHPYLKAILNSKN